ncbi:XAC2610-related protein [Pedobacter ureilyticus]|uniref:XAC2610-related protein n=1 Tax=Pedobacter ureilyticus TaxID=1393051 RepID=A0ABW9J492_9SPHI|nr:hypothetical protein [Pedobacter helvus]
MKFKYFAFLAFLMPTIASAQMKLKSFGTAKPIELTLGWEDRKAAFVWYKGQKEPIALKFKSLTIDSSDRESGQPNFNSYTFTEMYQGKATGEYGFTEWPRNVDDIYYIRYKDGKKFKFELDEDDETYDGKSMALLHQVQFHYYSFFKDSLKIVYPDGSTSNLLLNELDEGKNRRMKVKDYNFDGVDDISFDITSADGLNVAYDIFIYNRTTKKFNKLMQPKNTGCGEMVNLKIDKQRKELTTMCKSGPKWNSFTYKFNKVGKLVLVRED